MKNAIIVSTFIGKIYGKLSYSLTFNYDGSGQGISRIFSVEEVEKNLEIAEVECWEELKNKYVRVGSTLDRIYKIGNILTDKCIEF